MRLPTSKQANDHVFSCSYLPSHTKLKRSLQTISLYHLPFLRCIGSPTQGGTPHTRTLDQSLWGRVPPYSTAHLDNQRTGKKGNNIPGTHASRKSHCLFVSLYIVPVASRTNVFPLQYVTITLRCKTEFSWGWTIIFCSIELCPVPLVKTAGFVPLPWEVFAEIFSTIYRILQKFSAPIPPFSRSKFDGLPGSSLRYKIFSIDINHSFPLLV